MLQQEGGNWRPVKDARHKNKRKQSNNHRFVQNKESHASVSPEPQSVVIDVADSSDDSYYKSRTKSDNWSRYEEETEADYTENEQMTAADFEFLQENSATAGAHFKFSSEKDWENDTEAEKMMNISYFSLNVSLLNAGLQTIPFYKRLDYGKSLFPKNKIKEMDQGAEKAEAAYKDMLKGTEDEIRKKLMSFKSRESSAKSNKNKSSKPTTPKTDETAKVANEKDDELDKLLNMTESDVAKENVSEEVPAETQPEDVIEGEEKTEAAVIEAKGEGQEVEAGNKEDIQQWLDGILDD